MNKDTVAGAIKEKGGQFRAEVNEKLGDKEGVARGKADQVAGKAQKKYGELKGAI